MGRQVCHQEDQCEYIRVQNSITDHVKYLFQTLLYSRLSIQALIGSLCLDCQQVDAQYDISTNDVHILDILFLIQEELLLGCIRNWSRCAIKIIIFPSSHVSLRRTRLEK